MALFEKADPDVKAQRDAEAALKAKRKQGDNKAADLTEAESELAKCLISVQQAALGDDKAKRRAALEAKREAEDEIAALREAAATIRKEIADIEAQIERIIDQRMRVATSAAVLEMANQLEVVFGDFENVARALEDADAWRALIVPSEADNVKGFMGLVRQELQRATAITLAAFKAHAAAVLAGTARPSLPVAAPPPVKLAIVPAEPMVNVFALKNLKYVNREGGVTTICRNKRHDLPQGLAALAISSNMALPLSEKKRMEDLEYNAESFYLPAASDCVWLGPPGPEAPARSARPGGPITHSQFEPRDRGAPYPATFQRPPEPEPMPLAVGARKAEESESR